MKNVRMRIRLLAVPILAIGGMVGAAVPGAAAAPASSSTVPGTSGKPTFTATFTGSSLNTKVWATCYPWMNAASGCTNFGNSSEQEWYLPSQDQVSGGALHLVAQPVATQGTNSSGKAKTYACRSGMVTSYPGFNFEYGTVQIVAQIPKNVGLWPALWLLPTNESWPPEIDMLESWGTGTSASTGLFFHPVTGGQVSAYPATGDLSSGWHTFTLSWTATSLTYYIDRKSDLTVTANVPHQKMYILADLADYSMSSAGSCQGSMLIQSVNVWQSTLG
jgi:beta-glucanase (GH16 family)